MLRARFAVTPIAVAMLAWSLAPAFAAPPPRAVPWPTPSPATARPAAADALSGGVTSVPRALGDVCGTRAESGIELVTAHAARTLDAPLPTPHSQDIGPIAVLEDDGTFFYTTAGQTVADLAAIGQAFYRTHGDDYDCLAVYLTSGLTTWLGSYSALAAAFVLRNDVQGIGLDPIDVGANMGSPSRLQWMLSMNGLLKYPSDPNQEVSGDTFTTLDVLAHEFAHRWCAYTYVDSAGNASPALLGRQRAHWSFFKDSNASMMEGCDWGEPAPDSFRVDALTERYDDLDLYLMGALPAAGVDSFFTLHDATDFNPPGLYEPATWPALGTSCDARQFWWHLSDIEALNGPRIPDAASAPRHFRVGLILVVPRGQDPFPADLDKLNNIRSQFLPYFSGISQGLLTLDISLDSHPGSIRFAHDPVKDHLDFDMPIPVTARIDIEPGSLPTTLDAASPSLSWRIGTSGPFASVPMTPAGPDSFTAAIPANPGTLGPVQYWMHAASETPGVEGDDPPGGAASPYAFVVGPDLAPPVIVHTPVRRRSDGQMPATLVARVTDNVGLDSLSVEWSVSGSPPVSSPFTPVGHDSFEVAIGAGATEGQTVSYEIVARDASANVAIHHDDGGGGSPWVIAVGRDAWFDFENGLQDLMHASGSPTYRDAWHPTTEEASPAGGTAWKCGAEPGLPYPVHLDADLLLPELPVIEPGTVLRFAHRYELEEANASLAWDGARIEGQVGAGPWAPLEPQTPYSHVFYVNDPPFEAGTPCWSGASGGWRTEAVDLSPLAPGPARVRFRMLADDFIGFDGWIVDSMIVDRPGDVSDVPVVAGPIAFATPWPNPATDRLHVALALPRESIVDWNLYDLAGRRVTSWPARSVSPGRSTLEASLPASLGPGIYFSRVRIEGFPAATRRIAVIR